VLPGSSERLLVQQLAQYRLRDGVSIHAVFAAPHLLL
jgi:hypothetical protein